METVLVIVLVVAWGLGLAVWHRALKKADQAPRRRIGFFGGME